MQKPDFFIVGAPKCGTTAMNDYLRQHPEIFLPAKKEIHFFGSELVFQKSRVTEEEYFSHYRAVREEKRIGEAAVWYLYSKRAAAEIKEFNPEARSIIMLRNPVDMMYSMHGQRLYNDNEDIRDFEEALAAEAERQQGRRLYKNAANLMGFFYRDIASYTPQVQRYFAVFGRDKVHVIIFDDFKSDTAQAYRATCEFLGVDPHFRPEFAVINPSKTVHNKTLRSFLRYPPPPASWLLKLLQRSPVRLGIRKRLRSLNTKYESRPPMNPELKRRLQVEFLPEVQQLGELLGRDLTHWCRKEVDKAA
ncbi:MAG: sulfotransferase [Deltaproteobacteria bacterium]|nr:sulfotransferase [Deltaproteobacteria bacterium]